MLTEVMMSLFKGRSQIDKSELLFSKRDLLKIIIPVFFQQILNMTVGMINTMMVSNAGDAAVAGVSLVVTLDNVLIVFFTALVTGGAVIVAQRLGTSNTKDISEALKSQHGIELDKRKLELDGQIKAFGTYKVEAKLYTGISGKFNVQVVEK